MSRQLASVAVALFVFAVAGSASAVSAKWCFQWRGSYADAGFGEDYLNVDDAVGSNYIEARYTHVKIEKRVGIFPYYSYVVLWDGYLDFSNCSPNVEVLPGWRYRFTQYLSLHRSSRVIDVHPDGEDWDGEIDKVVTSITTPSPLISWPTYNAPIPPDSTNNRLMPALVRILSMANSLDLPDGVEIDVSTWGVDDLYPGDPGLGCGSWCSGSSGQYHICISDGWSNDKYNIAHEVGHTVSNANDGPHSGSYWGSDGFYQATGVYNRCDCTYISGYSHCPTSREFTGSGQKEGFSHFIAAASYNDRDDVDGVFVFYKNLMEWSSTHGGTLPTPSGVPYATVAHPYPGYLSTSDDVKWADYECSPTGDFQEHMGTEWDWLSFFWNLWAINNSNQFSVDEINTVWDGIPDDQIAYDCCQAYDDDPGDGEYWIATDCLHTSASSCIGLYPHAFVVGKLWSADVANHGVTTGLLERVAALYGAGSGKYNHFNNTGIGAMVTY